MYVYKKCFTSLGGFNRYSGLTVFGEVRVSRLISDHMVIQQGMRVKVWGWATPKEEIKVELNGQVAVGKAGPDGTWSVVLPPQTAGGPYDLTITGKNKIVVKDVLVGEVWVASANPTWP